MGLRVISGQLKGRKLRSVGGTKTRPTADRIREAIFSILSDRLPGANVLDLFAGTGAFGIEALSRGALAAVFVDIDNDAIAVLRQNVKNILLENRTKIIQWDITQNLECLRSFQSAFNLIFMDPPYRQQMIAPTLINLHSSQCLRAGACIIVEHTRQEQIPVIPRQYAITDQRRYGKTIISFLNYEESPLCKK
jgi:16S rRNA (guanine966-N2)-methyltransferase